MFIEMKSDFLQHGLGICSKHRMLTTIHELAVELTCIGHVEITHDHQGTGWPV